jgi:lipopolysaccharide transport system ATP-binding protein
MITSSPDLAEETRMSTKRPRSARSELLVQVDGVSKKFCRTLKRSLWYGMQDIAAEIAPAVVGRKARREGASLRRDEFWAVRDVSFELRRGECLGLIGHNGAGKTTLLKMLNGLIKPDTGRIEMHGQVGALIALGAGFNPILSGRENIFVNASVLGIPKRTIDEKFDEIIDFAEIGDFIDAPVQSYSSGMAVRLGFAVATAFKPDVLILDEVLAVGDVAFRSKCWKRVGELLENAAVIFVSHEAYAISRLCDRAILLDHGRLICDEPANKALEAYAAKQPQERPVTVRSLHEAVIDIDLQPRTTQLVPGDSFEFDLEVHMRHSATVDDAFVNICDPSGVVHAQCHMQFPDGQLEAGRNLLRIRLGPLYLSRNTYYPAVVISTKGGKVPLLQSRNQMAFHFESHVNYGPHYYPPNSVHRLP